MGFEADDLLSTFDSLSESDIWQYRYPSEHNIESIGIQGIYLGNYVRWDPMAQHAQMVEQAGYYSATMQRTFDIYDHVDDWHYMGLHDWLKRLKHGYSRVLDQACREIRHGRLSRQDALKFVGHYSCQTPNHVALFLEWLGLDSSGLQYILDSRAREWPSIYFKDSFLLNHGTNPFQDHAPNATLDYNLGPVHVTVGRGYP
jgi:hypothetical protein